MNEHIKLLKEQAMEWVPNRVDPDTKIRLLNAGKFAELIVQECMRMCDVADMSLLEHNCVKEASGTQSAKDFIKEHFGVEE
jgi:hypothetical protein